MFSDLEGKVRGMVADFRASAAKGEVADGQLVADALFDVLDQHELDRYGACDQCSLAGSIFGRILRRRVLCRAYRKVKDTLESGLTEDHGRHALRAPVT
ncbi:MULTISPECIES: hypothetical protein [unclassified Crossiella]|uniref:hypothetical protein n=1 Tax=unclassified Crossiella TaxID=2620835 RepID=UPI001FFE9D8F|nr:MULTISPECIES: hypothetical protein [unclassified Crossiella]MCK2241888.1 hypothetical protein [Crossiella sp. S99.2]MCK2255791.1 hypothetical protein [Crossiella sp. S99.1]